MLQCSFSFVAAQLLVKMTSELQKSECCSAVSAAQLSENCSATSLFSCGMLQEWGLGIAAQASSKLCSLDCSYVTQFFSQEVRLLLLFLAIQ